MYNMAKAAAALKRDAVRALLCTLSLQLIFSQEINAQTSSYGKDFYIGLMKNVGGTTLTQFRLTIGTTAENATFAINTINNVFEYKGSVAAGNPQVVDIPNDLQVTDAATANRAKGIHIESTNDQFLIVIVENFVSPFNHGAFLAYPCLAFENKERYEYYILSTHATNFVQSQFLLVGCEDETTVTVTPTRPISIPQDPIMTSSALLSVATGNTSHEFSVSRMQTILVSSDDDLSGTRVVSNKPLTVISGHECANVPFDASGCEPLAIQVPPTSTLGNTFLLAPFAGRTSSRQVNLVSSDNSASFSYSCGSNREIVGQFGNRISFTSTEYCYLETAKPTLVAELSSGGSLDRMGDPAIALVSPINQYLDEVSFITLRANDFPTNYISVTVTAEHYEPSNIILDGDPINCEWTMIRNSGDDAVVGYGCHKAVTSNNQLPTQHTIKHNRGLLSVLVYGFRASPGLGYAYLAGQRVAGNGTVVTGDLEFLPFFDIKSLSDVKQLPHTLDATSEPVIIPDGFIFGDKLITRAFINENGVISFNKPWKYSYPDTFPTSYFWTRKALAIAPFWSDNDIRKDGEVRYVSYCNLPRQCNISHEGQAVLDDVNNYVQNAIQEENKPPFVGHWVMVVHWDHVHPSPHGAEDHNGITDDVLNQSNNYQAVIVSNTIDTYVVFTYMCGDIQWSSVGGSGAAVVGFNAEGDAFHNHPHSGFDSIGEAVSCVVEFGKRRRRQETINVTRNDITKVYTQEQFAALVRNCDNALREDQRVLPIPAVEFERLRDTFGLEPCPGDINKLDDELGRFMRQTDIADQCYITTKPIQTSLHLSGESISATQQCCYDENGALQVSRNVGHAGTVLLYHPVHDTERYEARDKQFRDFCCAIDDTSCRKYFDQREIDNGDRYTGLAIASGNGDPHYTTFDGKYYHFQGFGEFTTLEISPLRGPPVFILQGRHFGNFQTRCNRPCVTWHVAIAFGRADLAFQLNAPFRLVQTKPVMRDLTNQVPTDGSPFVLTNREGLFYRNGVRFTAALFKTGVVVIATVYTSHMNVEVRVPRSYEGRTRGLFGILGNNDGGNDLYTREGMGPLTDSADADLFGPLSSWEVQPGDSLFFDQARRKRQSPNPNPAPIFLEDLEFTDSQRMICENNIECMFDLAATGSEEFGLNTLNHHKRFNVTMDQLNNSPPNISADSPVRVNVGQENVMLINVIDPGDNVTLSVQGGLPDNSILEEIAPGQFSFRWTLLQITYSPLVFVANDTRGASSSFVPIVEICACANGGNCSLDGIISNNATLVMNCLCSEAFDGMLCEEDRDGCSEIECFEGVECMDVPAPGVGAVCGSCPPGYTGDALKCYDIDECFLNSTLCDQLCINTDGGYFCSCRSGYQLIAGSSQCEDINECNGVNDCQQMCQNTDGSYVCSCTDGFTLEADGRSCAANEPCLGACSFGCALIDGQEQCFCQVGFELDTPGRTNCIDINECQQMSSLCEQLCTNTNGSFECRCREGYELGDDGKSCSDINECFEAALESTNLCESDLNSQCVNTEGSFECVCVPGYILNENGTCEQIINEPPPPPPPVIRPASSVDNSLNYTSPTLNITSFSPERKQRFRQVAAEAVTNYCSEFVCELIISDEEKQQVIDLKVEPTNVALPSSLVFDNMDGQLIFTLYIQVGDGFLSKEQLRPALLQAEEQFRNAGFLTPHPTTLPTTLPPTTMPIEVNCSVEANYGECDKVILRFFFNPRKGVCEPFIYSGCEGNGNNFESLEECNQHCNFNECPPYCTIEYCSTRSTRTSLCTLRETDGSECDAKCRVTYCHVCYYDDEYRPLHQNCKACTRTEIEQRSKCFRQWTTCTRRADGASYPKVRSRDKTHDRFKCYEHPCV